MRSPAHDQRRTRENHDRIVDYMKVAVILPAAGLGTRMGKGTAEKAGTSRKQFMLLEGSPILMHTVRKFAASDRVGEIVVAVRAEDVDWVSEMMAREFDSRVRVVEAATAGRSPWRTPCARWGPTAIWWRCMTRFAPSSSRKPFIRFLTKPPLPEPLSSACRRWTPSNR